MEFKKTALHESYLAKRRCCETLARLRLGLKFLVETVNLRLGEHVLLRPADRRDAFLANRHITDDELLDDEDTLVVHDTPNGELGMILERASDVLLLAGRGLDLRHVEVHRAAIAHVEAHRMTDETATRQKADAVDDTLDLLEDVLNRRWPLCDLTSHGSPPSSSPR